MKLMTKEIAARMPKMRSSEGVPADKKIAHVKFFFPMGRGTWYGVEYDGVDEFYGYVVSPLGSDCDEWGYFTLSELESVVVMGLHIERDLYFKPQPIQPLIEEAQRS